MTIYFATSPKKDIQLKAIDEVNIYFETRKCQFFVQEFLQETSWRLELLARPTSQTSMPKFQSLQNILKNMLCNRLANMLECAARSVVTVVVKKCSSSQSQRFCQSDSGLDETRNVVTTLAGSVPQVMARRTISEIIPNLMVRQDQHVESTVFQGTDSRKLHFDLTGTSNISQENGHPGDQLDPHSNSSPYRDSGILCMLTRFFRRRRQASQCG